ncbi:MAG: hypothetical protein JXA64_01840 [Candidatus Fermentibacteraceae bacterium]|nr:hypothetical protein [Candidatus Fermentibacteraceae bacterium]MBN2607828.1 hypothetical protein [Candidatus Fermentibacteraceae bacterium]
MRRELFLYLFAVLFLALAVVTGSLASSGRHCGNDAAEATVTAGVGEIGRVLADILWLQMDRYHHIWMYQGRDWTSATDYLPQLWLVIRLNPGFPDAYIDGAYHLGINLGFPEESMRLLQQGVRNCPDNEGVYWERLIVLWQSNYLGTRETRLAAWDYLDLVRRKGGNISDPWNEANAAMIIGFTFQDDTLRRNSSRLAERYIERREFMDLSRAVARGI